MILYNHMYELCGSCKHLHIVNVLSIDMRLLFPPEYYYREYDWIVSDIQRRCVLREMKLKF